MLLRQDQGVFPSNYFTSPTCLLSKWLIKVKKSQPSTAACFAFPPAGGGSVSGLAAWPYYKLIETLFRNTKVNISSHVIPISLQWIPLNRGYWVADPMCYLNSRRDTHIQSLGMREGDWTPSSQTLGERGGGEKGYLVLPLLCVSISCMSNFITGILSGFDCVCVVSVKLQIKTFYINQNPLYSRHTGVVSLYSGPRAAHKTIYKCNSEIQKTITLFCVKRK